MMDLLDSGFRLMLFDYSAFLLFIITLFMAVNVVLNSDD